MKPESKRSLTFLGHAQAGKTTLAESILYFCKAATRKGSVLDGTTVSDYSFDEIERKSSINASLLFCDYKEHRIQMIDAPGYADFFGEAVAGVRATDSAVIVIDGTSGVEVGTERAWQIAEEAGLACMFFINKIDKEDADSDKTLLDMQERLSKKCVFMDSMDSPELLEAVAESDDGLLEKYLEGAKFTPQEVESALTSAVAKRKVFPVLKGSALNDKGTAEFLDAVLRYLPSPMSRPGIEGRNAAKPEEKIQIAPAEAGPLSGFVFKSISDPYVGQLTLLRIFSGTLASNTGFYNSTKKTRERIGQILLLQGKEQRPAESACCGDIVAIAKLKETVTSDSISDERGQVVVFDPIVFPEPAISASVKPKTRQDEDKISGALHKLSEEDPTFKVSLDTQTKELIISGLGELHLMVMVGRLKKRFNVEVALGTPKVSYKETITKTAKVQGKFKRQSGGRGQYGDVWLSIEPLERGKGFEFVDKIFGGAIPNNFIPSVEKGVIKAMAEGAVAGYPIEDVRVTLVDGSYHEVDSSDMAFQIAGGMALRKAMQEAGPVLLEPVMDVEIMISEENLGGVSGDINSRRGRIMGMDVKGKSQVVKAQIPLAEMFTYANDLRSITGGRGSYTMRFSHYEQVPHKVASAIISQYQATRKQEEEQ